MFGRVVRLIGAEERSLARVTLATIAKQTGLSKFAVSRSLSGKDGVSEATRARVLQTAAEMGYRRRNRRSKPARSA